MLDESCLVKKALLSNTWEGRVRRVGWSDCNNGSRFTEGGAFDRQSWAEAEVTDLTF
jgi:hypothetical protein